MKKKNVCVYYSLKIHGTYKTKVLSTYYLVDNVETKMQPSCYMRTKKVIKDNKGDE